MSWLLGSRYDHRTSDAVAPYVFYEFGEIAISRILVFDLALLSVEFDSAASAGEEGGGEQNGHQYSCNLFHRLNPLRIRVYILSYSIHAVRSARPNTCRTLCGVTLAPRFSFFCDLLVLGSGVGFVQSSLAAFLTGGLSC